MVLAMTFTAKAHAGQYKMLLCAGNVGSNAYGTFTNTTSPQNPGGIFNFENYCGPAPDPAGNNAFFRISENQPGGNAGFGASGFIYWDTPASIHYKTAGGWQREAYAFNEGWRSRFWGVNFANQGFEISNQGFGVGMTSTFSPHLWPGGNADFWRFAFELECVRPSGCDRTNFNSTDANTFVFTLEDDQNSQVALTNGSPLMTGGWVKGNQTATFVWNEHGSGIRFERIRIDGAERWNIDHQATGECNVGASQSNGEFARVFQPCPNADGINRAYTFDTASLADGAHSLQACTQDYGQYIGLNGTGSESCDQRTIRTDNTPPGAPSGLRVTSENPARYLDKIGASFALPPNSGSPITKVHYDILDAAGKVVEPEKVVSATNPTELANVEAPKAAGAYQLRVWLEDEVGFTGPATTAPIPHDTTPPAAPQDLSVTAPTTSRADDGFDVRWRNIADNGSPIDGVHYQILNAAGKVVVPTQNITGTNPQTIQNLESPPERGTYSLRLWLSDSEGNVGAPVKAPLSYDCVRSDVGGGLTLSAGLGKNIDPSVVVHYGHGSTLRGNLKGAGQLSNAPLCIFSKVVTDQEPKFLGVAMTGNKGDYQFAIGAGPSREITVVYRPDQRELEADAVLRTRVRPSFRLKKTVVHNHGVGVFTGSIPGPDDDNVVVLLQVKDGTSWRVFRGYRTQAGGHYNMRYRFTQTTTPTTYITRTQIRAQRGYPYQGGDSRPLPLRVLP